MIEALLFATIKALTVGLVVAIGFTVAFTIK